MKQIVIATDIITIIVDVILIAVLIRGWKK